MLATLRLYAMVHYMVRLRTPEIRIRMATGASPALVRREVSVSMRDTSAGVTLGLMCTLATPPRPTK
jgi:hypothetical protein